MNVVPAPAWEPPRGVLAAVRASLLLLCLLLSTATASLGGNALALGLLVLTASAMSLPVRPGLATRMQPVVGGVLAALIISATAAEPNTMLPYLLAPVVSAGLLGGVVTAVTTAGLASGAELSATIITAPHSAVVSWLALSTPWMLFTLAVGLLAAWVRRLQLRPPLEPDPGYAAAYRLLSQLRLISRQLSGGLDAVSLAEATLQTLADRLAPNRAVCLARATDHGQLVTLATIGGGLAGSLETDEHPLVREAWVAARPVTTVEEGTLRAVAFPLMMGVHTFGMLVLEWDGHAPELDEVMAARATVETSASRLGTALLFAEIRTIATAEERRRLAREIHDGIAQELASLGYAMDDLASRVPAEVRPDVLDLRAELSRVISELRLSIFDLRSGVLDAGGLGTAIGDYVQRIGASSDLTVHLVLDESSSRLPVGTEAEIFRIVQEAVTNARKHADAQNLWVTCRIDPPNVFVEVEDDGSGLGEPRQDSFGLMVMRERADRVGGRLEVTERPAGGTRVVVAIESPVAGGGARPSTRTGTSGGRS